MKTLTLLPAAALCLFLMACKPASNAPEPQLFYWRYVQDNPQEQANMANFENEVLIHQHPAIINMDNMLKQARNLSWQQLDKQIEDSLRKHAALPPKVLKVMKRLAAYYMLDTKLVPYQTPAALNTTFKYLEYYGKTQGTDLNMASRAFNRLQHHVPLAKRKKLAWRFINYYNDNRVDGFVFPLSPDGKTYFENQRPGLWSLESLVAQQDTTQKPLPSVSAPIATSRNSTAAKP